MAAGNLFKRLYLAGTSQSGATSQTAPEPVAVVQVRSAALIGWAVADHESAGPAIEGALKQPEPELQVAGVTAATAAYGKAGVSAALALLLPTLPPGAQVYAMRQLDPPEEQQVIAAAGEPTKRCGWPRSNGGAIGSAASVPVLFNAAMKGADNAKKVATAALASITGAGAGEAIEKLAAQGDAGDRAAAISILARRYDQAALPALLQYAAESDRA